MIDPVRCQFASLELARRFFRFAVAVAVASSVLLLAPQTRAQTSGGSSSASSSTSVVSAVPYENHYTWIESYSGSVNTDAAVMSLDSSVGYTFGAHTYVDAGLPIYFVRATATSATGTSTTNSFTALGDLYGLVRFSFPTPLLNFKTQFTGRAPTGSTSDGISTGHATYDWTNRVDRAFGLWTPFFEIGLADSIPDAFVYQRPFASYGTLAHFQAGTQYQILNWLGVAASGFDIAPWGSQTVHSRVIGKGAASNGHGPPFLNAPTTTGGSALTGDNGFAAAAVFSAGRTLDFTAGYSRSVHYDLNTFSFGITLNMREVLRRSNL